MADGNVAADQLRLFIERVERMHEERENLAADIRDVYAEARANGYDAKAIRHVVKLRKMEPINARNGTRWWKPIARRSALRNPAPHVHVHAREAAL